MFFKSTNPDRIDRKKKKIASKARIFFLGLAVLGMLGRVDISDKYSRGIDD